MPRAGTGRMRHVVAGLALALCLGSSAAPATVSAEYPQPHSLAGTGVAQPDRAPAAPARVAGTLPLAFEANRGQAPRSVRFLARGPGFVVLFEDGAVVVENAPQSTPPRLQPFARRELAGVPPADLRAQVTKPLVMRLALVGDDPAMRVRAFGRLPGRINDLTGRDPRRWHTDIPTFRAIKYTNVRPGIDLGYSLAAGGLSAVWLHGGAPVEPADVGITVSGARLVWPRGALGPTLRADGSKTLVLLGMSPAGAGRGGLRHAPIHASIGGEVPHVAGAATAKGFSVLLGGSGDDAANSIAVDAAGNSYVAGQTLSDDFPVLGGVQSSYGGNSEPDAFVSRLDPKGNLIYSTYLGGSDWDAINHIAVDATGAAYVTGATFSTDFPVSHPLQPRRAGGVCTAVTQQPLTCSDAFVAKLNPSGDQLAFSTYLGGSDYDEGNAIAVDRHGDVFVAGLTGSKDFPLSHAMQSRNRGNNCVDNAGRSFACTDAFVSELSPNGQTLIYSTFLGGSNRDCADDLAIDSSGAAYITGYTASGNFPLTPHAFQREPGWTRINADGYIDAFVAKIGPGGRRLLISTYLGGKGNDEGTAIALDPAHDIYVTGYTESDDFPVTPHVVQRSNHGTDNVFVTEFAPYGRRLKFSTYLGGHADDEAFDLTLDRLGNIYLTGSTSSHAFPDVGEVASWGRSGAHPAGVFVSELGAGGRSLELSLTPGVTVLDWGAGIALDRRGNVFVAGVTRSSAFPAHFVAGTTGIGGDEAFVAKLVPAPR